MLILFYIYISLPSVKEKPLQEKPKITTFPRTMNTCEQLATAVSKKNKKYNERSRVSTLAIQPGRCMCGNQNIQKFTFHFQNKPANARLPVYLLIILIPSPRFELRTLGGYTMLSINIETRTYVTMNCMYIRFHSVQQIRVQNSKKYTTNPTKIDQDFTRNVRINKCLLFP